MKKYHKMTSKADKTYYYKTLSDTRRVRVGKEEYENYRIGRIVAIDKKGRKTKQLKKYLKSLGMEDRHELETQLLSATTQDKRNVNISYLMAKAHQDQVYTLLYNMGLVPEMVAGELGVSLAELVDTNNWDRSDKKKNRIGTRFTNPHTKQVYEFHFDYKGGSYYTEE